MKLDKLIKKIWMVLFILIFTFSFLGCGSSSQATTVMSTEVKSTANKQEQKNNTKLDKMTVHYIDVGQGDSELIQIGDKNILIDAGTSDKKALDYLKGLGISKLDYVIATHPHEDHIGSMDDVINAFEIGTFYAPKATTTTKTYENMITAIKNKNLKISVPKVGDNLTIGSATLTFLAPNSETYENLNNYSIVIKIKYGNTSFIFEGDAEDTSENEILAKQLDIQADVIKIGHHGSNTSTSQAYLDKVNPKYAIISCGKDNDYGHPHKETIDKLNAKGIKTFRTDLEGTIITTSDGENITFNVQPVDQNTNVPGTAKEENSTTSTNDNNTVSSTSSGTTTNEPAQGERTVYWTPNGKSYHYDKNCKTLKRSKTILEGPASKCPKTDPCDICAK